MAGKSFYRLPSGKTISKKVQKWQPARCLVSDGLVIPCDVGCIFWPHPSLALPLLSTAKGHLQWQQLKRANRPASMIHERDDNARQNGRGNLVDDQ